MSLAFYGHHGSLVSGASFSETESFLSSLSNEIMGAMPEAMRSLPEEPQFLLCGRNAKKRDEVAFALMLCVRMLHSCLIDADWLATESFMSPEESATRRRKTYKGMTEMSALLEAYLHEKEIILNKEDTKNLTSIFFSVRILLLCKSVMTINIVRRCNHG